MISDWGPHVGVGGDVYTHLYSSLNTFAVSAKQGDKILFLICKRIKFFHHDKNQNSVQWPHIYSCFGLASYCELGVYVVWVGAMYSSVLWVS